MTTTLATTLPDWRRLTQPKADLVPDVLSPALGLLRPLMDVQSLYDGDVFQTERAKAMLAGWDARTAALEDARQAVVDLSPGRAEHMRRSVWAAENAKLALQAATQPRATRKQREAAQLGILNARNTVIEAHTGLQLDYRHSHLFQPADFGAARVHDFDRDGNRQVSLAEAHMTRVAANFSFSAPPDRWQQKWDGDRLFSRADTAGDSDGIITAAELAKVAAAFDADGDGWLSVQDFNRLERELGPTLVSEQHLPPTR